MRAVKSFNLLRKSPLFSPVKSKPSMQLNSGSASSLSVASELSDSPPSRPTTVPDAILRSGTGSQRSVRSQARSTTSAIPSPREETTPNDDSDDDFEGGFSRPFDRPELTIHGMLKKRHGTLHVFDCCVHRLKGKRAARQSKRRKGSKSSGAGSCSRKR